MLSRLVGFDSCRFVLSGLRRPEQELAEDELRFQCSQGARPGALIFGWPGIVFFEVDRKGFKARGEALEEAASSRLN